MDERPLGRRAYGSIPHLPGSELGGDRYLPPTQVRWLVERAPKGSVLTVEEKLDGSCVAVANEGGRILALGREGKLAATSGNEARRLFADWVDPHRFDWLGDGERVVGEWLALAHGTRYELSHEPFVAFDVLRSSERLRRADWVDRARAAELTLPFTVHRAAIGVEEALALLGDGGHGAIDPPEGVVYRLERSTAPTLVAKVVRPGKVAGALLPENSGRPAIWNWRP
ncbi:MAG: RNA ligase family protein [Deltaproteobacteria bacterium]|nr:RNA ligase family protein [Deltaproteobacteria bacterium]